MPDDLICLSHLRWDLVFQRPQHLMSRFARNRRVFFVEEGVFDADTPELSIESRPGGVHIVVPHLTRSLLDPDSPDGAMTAQLTTLFAELMRSESIEHPVVWYYTPMALPFSREVEASAIIYDCMDELSAFAGAPPRMVELERELFGIADLVFTGGRSLYEAKRSQHHALYCFPSSVDVPHFARARRPQPDVPDMADIPHPRIGFYGVLDERMDLDLLDGLAAARPEWQIVLLGPVTKIEERSLPRRPNLHYLGPRPYDDLPAYLAGWDVALLPFARNESTRFISPTKTPEYLAAGKPVVSTSIPDVVHPYGEMGLVQIADTVEDTVSAIEAALAEGPQARRQRADELLRSMSWDNTWAAMNDLLLDAARSKEAASV